MDIITKQAFLANKTYYTGLIQNGAIFVYPTDTIYGIGCDAANAKAVAAIRELKGRPTTPFSIIVPSKQWIEEHCAINPAARQWLDKLPGPYTLILPKKDGGTVGVRIPDHWISRAVEELGIPVITTSVNRSGEQPIPSPHEISQALRKHIAFCIDDGPLNGTPSTLVHLDAEEPRVVKRS